MTPKNVIGGIMLRLICLIVGLTYLPAFSAVAELSGFDVRNKSDRYELVLGPDNDLLEERDITLFKVNSKGRSKIHNGLVVFMENNPAKDVEAIYRSENLTLQLGKLQSNIDKRTGRRVIVVKLNELSKNRKTLVFESKELLEMTE